MQSLKGIFVVLALLIFLASCSRALTPYEAANNPKGKKCRALR